MSQAAIDERTMRELHLASVFTVAVRKTLGEIVYPEVTIERRSFASGQDSWAICWAGNVYGRDGDYAWDSAQSDKQSDVDAHRKMTRYTLSEAFEVAPAAIEKARETMMPEAARAALVSLLEAS